MCGVRWQRDRRRREVWVARTGTERGGLGRGAAYTPFGMDGLLSRLLRDWVSGDRDDLWMQIRGHVDGSGLVKSPDWCGLEGAREKGGGASAYLTLEPPP